MRVLRSAYVPTSSHLIPSCPSSDGCTPLNRSRETIVLNLFIALKVQNDICVDESELHFGQPEAFRDLFDLMQPRAHLEDFLCANLAPSPRHGFLRGASESLASRVG